MRHVFEAEQWLPYPVETVFAFFVDPANLPRLMPAWQAARIDEQMIAPPPPRADGVLLPATPAAGAGTRLTLSFRPFPLSPVRLKWDAEIDQFAWNDHFCDKQMARGPFKFWHHCHRVCPADRDGQPGSLLHDRVDFEVPFGLAGDLAARTALPLQLRSIFRFRQRRTAELLGSAPR